MDIDDILFNNDNVDDVDINEFVKDNEVIPDVIHDVLPDVIHDVIPDVVKIHSNTSRVMSQKQRDALMKGRLVRDENARIRKVNREIQRLIYVKEYEDKLISKALSLRKKQIRNDYEMSLIEDDNTTEEDIKFMYKSLNKKKQQQQQQQPQQQQQQQPPHTFRFM